MSPLAVRACRVTVAAGRLAGAAVGDREVGAGGAGHRVQVQPDPGTRRDADADVAGGRLTFSSRAAPCRRVMSPEAVVAFTEPPPGRPPSRRWRCVRHVAADRPDVQVAGGGCAGGRRRPGRPAGRHWRSWPTASPVTRPRTSPEALCDVGRRRTGRWQRTSAEATRRSSEPSSGTRTLTRTGSRGRAASAARRRAPRSQPAPGSSTRASRPRPGRRRCRPRATSTIAVSRSSAIDLGRPPASRCEGQRARGGELVMIGSWSVKGLGGGSGLGEAGDPLPRPAACRPAGCPAGAGDGGADRADQPGVDGDALGRRRPARPAP